MKKLLLLFLTFWFTTTFSQVSIYSESFESGSSGFTQKPIFMNEMSGDYFISDVPGNSNATPTYIGVTGRFAVMAADLDGIPGLTFDSASMIIPGSSSPTEVAWVKTTAINTTGYTSIVVKLDVAAASFNPTYESYFDPNADFLQIDYSTDDTSYSKLGLFASNYGFASGFLSLDTNGDNVGDGALLSSTLTEYSFNLSGLIPTDATVYIRVSVATNISNEEIAFDNLIVEGTAVTTPTVTTTSASAIGNTGATLAGNVTADGGATVTERGIVYAISSANANPQIGGGSVVQDSNGSGTGFFSESITGLAVGTQYSYNSYAINSQGTSYGTVATFTTTGLGWIGATTDWATTSNWSSGALPTSSDNVVIPNITNKPIIGASTGAVTNNLTVESGASLTIASGGSLIVQGTSSGSITYNRNLGTLDAWYLVGSPVVGETIEDLITNHTFATGTPPNIGLAPYLNNGTAWSYQTAASTGSLISGGGYSVRLATAGDISFTGTMPVADIGVSITSNTNAFNLVGNPYPSFMAVNTNAHATNNLLTVNTTSLTENTLWFWDQSTSSYDQINQASAAFHIAPGQGFFVSSTGSNTFNFTEAMQSHQSTDSFQKSSSTKPQVILILTDGSSTKDTDIYYIDGTTTGFDNGYDSSIFGGVSNPFAIYTHAVADGLGRNLGIQSLPNADLETMIIPVGIIATSGTDISILALATNLPPGFNVYLEDKNDGSFTLLSGTSKFSTTLTSDLNGIGRFYLHTTSSVLSTNDNINLNNVSIYTTDATTLRIAGLHDSKASLKIFTILGKQVLTTSFTSIGVKDIALPKLATGVYLVQLQTDKGELNKKIILE